MSKNQSNTMKSICPSIAFAIAIALSSVAQGASLSQYLAEGLKNNKGLQAAYQRYQAALHGVPQAKALPDPRAEFTHFISEIETRVGPQTDRIMLSQTLPWRVKRRLRGEVASRQAESVLHSFESKQLDLVRAISLAYYDYAFLTKATDITGQNLQLLKKLEPVIEEKIRGGSDLAPLLRLQVETAKTEDAITTLKADRARHSAALAALLSRDQATLIPTPNLPEPPTAQPTFTELARQLILQNPELDVLRSQIAKADADAQLAKKNPIPDPTIGLNYSRIGSGPSQSGRDAFGISIGFSIPIWFDKYRAQQAEANATHQAAKLERQEKQDSLLGQLKADLESYAEARSRVSRYRHKLLPAARQSIEVSEASYRADRLSILELIDSQRTLLDLEKIYWRAIADQHKSLVRLQTLTGKKNRS
jgi:cobalt-zinc-cadmium efflux system outer membrane protein